MMFDHLCAGEGLQLARELVKQLVQDACRAREVRVYARVITVTEQRT